MLNKIEAKIGRIDFVKANVDKIFREWQGRSSAQAPIHVRLVLWLKNNASTYGYEDKAETVGYESDRLVPFACGCVPSRILTPFHKTLRFGACEIDQAFSQCFRLHYFHCAA